MARGIQDNNTEKIDLVYTKLGRFLKSINSPDAKITKFALSDDGIDYNLYDINLPEDKRDLKIRRTAQFDAWTDEDAIMKNKLITLNRDITETTKMKVSPLIGSFEINPSTTSDRQVQTFTINVGYEARLGFNVRLSDSRYISLYDPSTPRQIDESPMPTPPQQSSRMLEGGIERQRLFRRESNGNKQPELRFIEGSLNVPDTFEFKVYYDESMWRKFDLESTYRTKIIVESIDSGEVQEIEFTLKSIENIM